LTNVDNTKAKQLFRTWNDTYRDLLTKNRQAARVAFMPQWETLTGTTGLWNSVYAKFRELERQGELARRRAGSPPVSALERIAMQEALQVICTYERYSRGLGRVYGGIGILGRPQNTDSNRNHQATVAWLVANYIVEDNSHTATIYMDRTINSVLSALGVNGIAAMGGAGSKPDIIRVRPDGKLDIIEVQSLPGQNDTFMDGLVNTIEAYFQANCPDRLGSVRWTPVTKAEADLYGVLLPR
jgi:hypothetical protein